MNKCLLLLTIGLSMTCSVSAQVPKADCPTLIVRGPSGNIPKDKPAQFTAVVDAKGKVLNLEYEWAATARGQDRTSIVSGQGTAVMEVFMTGLELTVTVKVRGFPTDCPSTASETIIIDPAPQASILDQFRGSISSVTNERFAKLVSAIKEQPYSQILVVIGSQKNSSAKTTKRREELLKRLGRTPEDYRITFIEREDKVDTVTVWLVPPGARPPTRDN
jgi:hypothetical protein